MRVEQRSLWFKVLNAKCEMENLGWKGRGSKGSIWWQNISSLEDGRYGGLESGFQQIAKGS